MLLGDARDAVRIRLGGIALDIAGRKPDAAGEHAHACGKGGAVALLLLEEEPGDEVACERRFPLGKRIGEGALQIGLDRCGAVEVVGRMRRDLAGELINAGFHRVGQLQVGAADGVRIIVLRGRGREHGAAHARGIRGNQPAGEGIDVAAGEGARGEYLAGGGIIRHDAASPDGGEALGQKEGACGVCEHGDGQGLGAGKHGRSFPAGAGLVEQIAPERGETGTDEQITPATGRIRPGKARVFVADSRAQERPLRGLDLHDRVV